MKKMRRVVQCGDEKYVTLFWSAERLYCLAFFLYSISAAVSHSTLIELSWYSAVELILQMSVCSLLAVKLFLQRYSLMRGVVTVLLLMFGLIIWRTSAEGLFFWGVLFITSAQDVKMEALIRTSLCAVVTSIVIVVSACFLGVIDGIVFSRGDGTARYALGFTHPNYFGLLMLQLSVLLIAVQWNRPPIAATAFTLVAVPFVSVVCDSRTSVAIMLFAVSLAWAIEAFRRFSNRETWKTVFCMAVIAVLVGSAAISLIVMVYFDSDIPVMDSLSVMLSGRPYYAHLYFEEHAPGLLGYGYPDGPMLFTGHYEKNFLVDNAYCSMFLRWGILAAMLTLLGCVLVVVKALREHYWESFIFGLLVFAVYGLTETFFLAIGSNVFLIALGALIQRDGFASLGGKMTLHEEGEYSPYQIFRALLGVRA